jgi:hypothetical protein
MMIAEIMLFVEGILPITEGDVSYVKTV